MSSVEELYEQADRLKDEGQLEAAIDKLNECLAVDPSYALAHSALAVVCGRVGRHEQAVEHARRVCELEPNDPFSYTALSVTYQRAFAGTNRREYIQLAEEAMAQSHRVQGHG
jgi:Flp pilus assembly protein TadD